MLFWLGGSVVVLALAMLTLLSVTEVSTIRQEAQVGMYAQVSENEFNTLARELIEKERELLIREQMIASREAELRGGIVQNQSDRQLLYMTVFGIVLFSLVVLNFVLDIRRSRQPRLKTIVKV